MGVIAGFAVPHPPLIIPAVGRGEEKAIQKTIDSYYEVARRIKQLAPEVLVVSSPHAPLFRDAFHVALDREFFGSLADFRAPEEVLSVKGDVAFARAIIDAAAEADIPAGPYGGRNLPLDHASFIPLWFLHQVGFDAPIVLMGFSGFSFAVHYRFGRIVASVAEKANLRVVWVASGDLSHKQKADGPYGYVPEGPEFDRRICKIFASGDLDRMADLDEGFTNAAAECGLRSFMLMAGALQGKRLNAKLLSHEDTFGVGYGVASFIVEESPDGIHAPQSEGGLL